MDGSTVLASMDASDQDNWDDADDIGGNATAEAKRIRFNNVNKIYKEGSNNNDLWVAVDVADSVDGSDTSDANWDVAVDTDGLRFTDGAGLDTFVDAGSDVASVSIEQSGAQSDLTITKDTSSPDAGNLEVDETSSTTATIAVFKAKADEDGGDIKIDDFPVTIATAGTGSENTEDVIDNVQLVVDGNTYDTDTDGEADGSTTYHFSDIEDDDVVINAGETMKITVKVKLKSQDACGCANGVTVLATSAAAESDFEDADTGDDIGDVSGTPAGEVQTLYSSGVVVSNFDSSYDTTTDAGDVTKQTFTIDFDVTAFGDTFYVPKTVDNVDTATAMPLDNTLGLTYLLENSAGTIQTDAMDNANVTESALTSSADTDFTGFFTVNEGDTETFHVTVEITPGDTAGFYHIQLSELEYDLDQTNNGDEAKTSFAPSQDYETQDVKMDL